MSMYRSIKLRIYPNKHQKKIIDNTLHCCRYIYNLFLTINKLKYDENKPLVHYYEFNKELNYVKKNNDKYKWISNYSSEAISKTISNADRIMSDYIRIQNKFPNFKSRKTVNKESYHFVKSSVHYTDNKNIIKLPILKKIRITNYKYLPDINKIVCGRICREYDRYYVIFVIIKDKKYNIPTGNSLGIDIGIRNYATIYDGISVNLIKHYKSFDRYLKYQDKINLLYKKIHNKCKFNYNKELNRYYDKYHESPDKEKNKELMSNAYQSSRVRVLMNKVISYENKLKNIRKDFILKLCNTLTAIAKPKCITIEDLSIKNILHSEDISSFKLLRKLIHYSNFYTFKRILTEKCEENNIRLRAVMKYIATTKKCSRCGSRLLVHLSDKNVKCNDCCLNIDRDENAAINIYNIPDNKCIILNA